MKQKATLLLSALVLTGCANMDQPQPQRQAQVPNAPPIVTRPAVEPKKEYVLFDKALLSECQPIPKLEGNTDVQLNAFLQAWAKVYNDCASSKSKLNAEVIRAFNVRQ
jgi:hypothetical protein